MGLWLLDVARDPVSSQSRPLSARPRVRLSGPGALVACLPQLIGFEPVESLVLVGLIPGRAGRREVGLTLRVDLDDVVHALEVALLEEDGSFDDELTSIPTATRPTSSVGGPEDRSPPAIR